MAIEIETADKKEQYENKSTAIAAQHHQLRQQIEMVSAENSTMTKLCKGLKNGKH